MITLNAQNLNVKYERQVALLIPELSLNGTVQAILGHNGAGKSTLLKTLLGLLKPQSGSLFAEHLQLGRLIPEKHMAFCPENGAVFEDIKVSDYLRIWLRLRSKNSSLSNPKIKNLLDLFEVDPLINKFGRELSKGQRRRVQSVVGFLIEPKLFLFDEPFDGLDVQRTAELASILESYKESTAFIISSHRMDVIERVADAGIVLADGEVVAKGQIGDLSTQLAGKSFLLNNGLTKNKNIITELSKSFGLYVTHIGEEVVLTGLQDNLEVIQTFITERSFQEFEIKAFKPTLTDAMGYHLQKRRIYTN